MTRPRNGYLPRLYIMLAASLYLFMYSILRYLTSETTPQCAYPGCGDKSRRHIPWTRNSTSETILMEVVYPDTADLLNSITDKSRYLKIGEIKPPAVLMRPKGGTGNQLFQYACHYSIARKNDWPLYVMIPNEYSANMANRTWETLKREFALDQFNIPLYDWNTANETWNIADVKEIVDFSILAGDYPLDKVIQQGSNDYCQSEAYFSSYKNELLAYYKQKMDIVPIKDWMKKIDETEESVAVHVRRGDFIRINMSVPLSYHRDAMNRIVSRLKGRNVAFFVFSDDIVYVQQNLFPHGKYIPIPFDINFVTDDKNPDSLQELFLMSRCKHQIVVDSTFSWWGAYLNRNPNKIVYAARIRSAVIQSFYPNNGQYVWEYRNIYYPTSWITIEPQWEDRYD